MPKTAKIQFSQETLAKIQTIISRYPEGRQKSALLPVLHLVQEELGGWLSVEVMNYVASLLNLQPIEVYEVATFYTLYNLKPVGKHVISVCTNISCMLRGSEEIVEHLKKKLNVGLGETTPDGKFTLREVECLGACVGAPMLQLGRQYHEELTPEKVDRILEQI